MFWWICFTSWAHCDVNQVAQRSVWKQTGRRESLVANDDRFPSLQGLPSAEVHHAEALVQRSRRDVSRVSVSSTQKTLSWSAGKPKTQTRRDWAAEFLLLSPVNHTVLPRSSSPRPWLSQCGQFYRRVNVTDQTLIWRCILSNSMKSLKSTRNLKFTVLQDSLVVLVSGPVGPATKTRFRKHMKVKRQ